jgi:hypothetical protein
MSTDSTQPPNKPSKAEQARINGAKSKGAKTTEGRRRAASVNVTHGLYVTSATVLDIESKEAFKLLRDAAFAMYRPRNNFEAQYVEEIADCSWRIARLRLCCTHAANVAVRRLRDATEHPLRCTDAITQTEVNGSSAQGAQTVLQRRINALVHNRRMIANELRDLKSAASMGTSQEVLQAQDLPVGTSQENTHGNQQDTQNNQ